MTQSCHIPWRFGDMTLHFTCFYELDWIAVKPEKVPVIRPLCFRLDVGPDGAPTVDEDAYWCSRLTEVVNGQPPARASVLGRCLKHAEANG